ncbi:MAG: hypothetical protein HN377_05340 [Alphaproteobacteria bacterium]|jgi:hypothetical protein|nr:hypothetical protein [Alphaproteobacteria bacterium]
MIAVISVLSFILAFGSIWFTSEALKRVDNYNDAKLKPHLLKINQVVNNADETIRALKGRVELLEKQVHTLKLSASLTQIADKEPSGLQANLQNSNQNISTVRLTG